MKPYLRFQPWVHLSLIKTKVSDDISQDLGALGAYHLIFISALFEEVNFTSVMPRDQIISLYRCLRIRAFKPASISDSPNLVEGSKTYPVWEEILALLYVCDSEYEQEMGGVNAAQSQIFTPSWVGQKQYIR